MTDLIQVFYNKTMNGKLRGYQGAMPPLTPTVLDEECARQIGLACTLCGSKKVVYAILEPFKDIFPPGAYCYKCLLGRCRLSRMIPFPIPAELLNKLKLDMGLAITTPPLYQFGPYERR